jgi:hypothetical protein
MLPELLLSIMTEALGESFSLDEFETSAIENVAAAVPVFVENLRAECLTGRNF